MSIDSELLESFRFYAKVAAVFTIAFVIILAGFVVLGWGYALGLVSGVGITALVACFALENAAPW